MYFTQVHEDAIIEFCTTTDDRRRDHLYKHLIQPAFSQMVDKIVYTYRFTTLPDIEDLQEECKYWLTTILSKFDAKKGSKAFSYFSVITKNWFIHKVKKNKKKIEKEIYIEAMEYSFENELLDKEEAFEDYVDRQQMVEKLKEEIFSWQCDYSKDIEKKVYDALIVLLESANEIEIFNKKAIYLYLREITGLSTKQIVSQLNKMKGRYKAFKKDWENGEI